MGKYSVNQNKNQHTNRKPKLAPENGLQNAQKEGVGKQKLVFLGKTTNADPKSKQNTSKTQKLQTRNTNLQKKLDFLVDPPVPEQNSGNPLKTIRKKKRTAFSLLKVAKHRSNFIIRAQGPCYSSLCHSKLCTDDPRRESRSCAATHARQGAERETEGGGKRERERERNNNNPTKNQQNPPPPKKKTHTR